MKRVLVLCSILLLLVPFTAVAQEIDYCEGNFDFDKDVDGSDASTFKQDFGRSGLVEPCPPDGPAPLEKTGQTLCYDTNGVQSDCAGTGEDGDYQKGVAPSSQRFTDHGDGTVTDNLSGLMWTKDAQHIQGQMTWQPALDACNSLDYAGYDDWRLPNIKELESLINFETYNPALPSGHPFINTELAFYWSSTSDPSTPTYAYVLHFRYGDLQGGGKGVGNYYYVWPVRGGH